MKTQVQDAVAMTEWDPMAPLEPGLMLLEASAGTGKTYNLVNWVLRLLVQYGIPIEQQVVVTFTRAATAELKDRIRTRLVEAFAAFSDPRAIDPSDIVMKKLLAAAQVSKKHHEDCLQRIVAAQESFDSCLISTIHGFCQRMLQHYAFEAQTDFDLTLVKDAHDLKERLVADWLSLELYDVDASRYDFFVEQCGFSRESLLDIATHILREPDMAVLPSVEQVDEDSPAWHRARFAAWLRAQYDANHQMQRTQSYVDLMRNLVRVLEKGESDPSQHALVEAVRQRYKVALIDEFQDTDGMQWSIFRTLFGGKDQRLYLIGDPKQAIYGFRGANIHVYLKAKEQTEERVSTIVTNFRSDQRFVEAINHAMDREGIFGQERIDYQTVQAAERANTPVDRLIPPKPWSDPSSAALQLRFIDQRFAGETEATDLDRRVTSGLLYDRLPWRIADDIVDLLQSDTRLFVARDPLTGEDKTRPVEPSDIAVLTHSGRQANAVQRALEQVGVPAVLMGADSVFASTEAYELLLWLEALDNAGQESAARLAATTHLFGRHAALLAALDVEKPEAIEAWEVWMERLQNWKNRFENKGLLSALRFALEDDLVVNEDGIPQDATARLLRLPDGQRRFTNLWHVAELLHDIEVKERRSLLGLIERLKQERMNPSRDVEAAELRLDRDDEAVRISTMHKAKGLQFPIVFVPFLWAWRLPDQGALALVVPNALDPSQRICDLRAPEDRQENRVQAELESRKEAIRLLYVALTRARFRCVVYLGHINRLEESPLGPVFHGQKGEGTRIERGVKRAATASQSMLFADLETLVEGSASKLDGHAPTISLTPCLPPEETIGKGRAPDPRQLSARDFLRYGLDGSWRRMSYSALTRGKKVTYLDAIEDREGVDRDEDIENDDEFPEEIEKYDIFPWTEEQGKEASFSDPSVGKPTLDMSDDSPDVPLASMRSGADVGTFFHEVFETMDFLWGHPDKASNDGPKQLECLVRQLLDVHGFGAGELAESIATGLLEVLRTPLRSTLGPTRLCDIAKADRLDELTFDFPIAGGDRFRRGGPRKRVESEDFVSALALRLNEEPGSSGEYIPIRPAYLRGLGPFSKMVGYMTGSIDMVFRYPSEPRGRWFIADYKSNRLDPLGRGRYPIEHFGLECMRYEMEQHHYYIQYHLYVLALHRYLRFRLGDAYDYERDVGGAYYLFFRGMIGPATPYVGETGYGCFFDKPPLRVIEALDTLFRDPSAYQGVQS